MNKLLIATALSIFAASCQKPKAPVDGKWKLSAMKIQQWDDFDQKSKEQIQQWNDSLSAATDTAMMEFYRQQISQLEMQVTDFTTRRDSMLSSTFWQFSPDGSFTAIENNDTSSGRWKYSVQNKKLYTKLFQPEDSVEVMFEGNKMILQFDSLNSFTLERVPQ
jgi:hypothetical protein